MVVTETDLKKEAITMIAYLFPGQGSQHKGMGAKLFDIFQDLSEKADAILGYSIQELCLRDPDNRLNHTQYTQPALYVVNAMSYLDKLARGAEKPTHVAGHSLGEYSALFAAGAFDFETGLRLVKQRGELMARTAEGGMTAVIGADKQTIEKVLDEHRLSGVDIAGLNTPTQIVLSGPFQELAMFEKHLQSSDTVSCVSLKVGAAFHSRYMADACSRFAAFLETVDLFETKITVIANATARPYENDRIRQLLCDQITHAVRWEETIRYLGRQGITCFEEIGPGRVLTGMVEQIQQESTSGPKSLSTPSALSTCAHRSQPPLSALVVGIDSKEITRSVGDNEKMPGTKPGRVNNKRQRKRNLDNEGADIAIIGIACRFPGADNYDQYWSNLEQGKNAIREITPDRWDVKKYYSPDINEPNKSISKWCGLIDDIDKFDNSFFQYLTARSQKHGSPATVVIGRDVALYRGLRCAHG